MIRTVFLSCVALATVVSVETESAVAEEPVEEIRKKIAAGEFSAALRAIDDRESDGRQTADTLVLRGECLLGRFERECHHWNLSSAGPIISTVGSLRLPAGLRLSEVTACQYRMVALGQEHVDLAAAHRAFRLAHEIQPASRETLRGLAKTSFYRAEKQVVLRHLRPLMDSDCRDVELLYLRGATRISLGELRKGAVDLQKVLTIEPDHFRSRRRLLDVAGLIDPALLKAQTSWFLENIHKADGTAHEASEYRQALLEIYGLPSDSSSKLRLARSIDLICERFPDRWEAWHLRGNLYAHAGELALAEETMSRTIRLMKGDFNPYRLYRGRAIVRQQLEDWSGALEDLAMAIQLEPLSAICYEDYNRSLRMLGRLDEIPAGARRFQDLVTLFEFHRKLDVRPGDGELWTDYAGHLAAMAELEWALTAYDRAGKQLPQSPDPILGTARVLVRQGKGEAAVKACDRAIQLGAGRKAVSIRGDAWLSLKKPTKALADFETAHRFDESVADAWLLLARQHLKSGDRQAAKEATARALKISPTRREEVARILDATLTK